jgi:hypothetical protein
LRISKTKAYKLVTIVRHEAEEEKKRNQFREKLGLIPNTK